MSDSLKTQTLQDRLDRLQELTEFTENCKKQLNDIFETLGWSLDDSNHQVTRWVNVTIIDCSLWLRYATYDIVRVPSS